MNKIATTIKTWFVVSDIHGFFDELKIALDDVGYDKKNKEYGLIVCGDIFDRGPKALEVYKFLKSIPKSRRILVRGNHELLYIDLLNKRYPESHDFSNHTVDTFCQIAAPQCNTDFDCSEKYFEYGSTAMMYSLYRGDEDEESYYHWQRVLRIVEKHEITQFIKSNDWVNYFELDNFIFVHSWIPVGCDDGLPAYYIENRHFTYRDEWRNATQTEWDDATWGCPWKMAKKGLNKTCKTIVCGHWHTSDFFLHLKNITKAIGDGPVYYSKEVIGLDGGVYWSNYEANYLHPQNILIIKDNICYDKYWRELKEPKAVPYVYTASAKKHK